MGFNARIRLFSAVKRKARGYRTVEYMTAMLYCVAGKLTLPCYLPTESSEEPIKINLHCLLEYN